MTLMISDKVAWSEGVLLRPQHFQQLDRYHESLLTARLEAIDAHNWGALLVELDELALQKGIVALSAFEGVMPDGTPVVIDAGSAPVALKPRPLLDHFPSSQRGLVVYLALPRERAGVTNYAQEGDQLRYALRARRLSDAARDDRHADVQLAVPNVRLLFSDEARDGYISLPIAEIMRDKDGALVVSDNYIPPCLRISCSRVIGRRLGQLLAAMIGRFRVLSDARRITGEGRVEFNAADVTRYLQLHALNSMLPTLSHLVRTGDASPKRAFLLLSQLAGQLATFSPDADMTAPIEFDFYSLESSFGPLFDLCEQLLSALDTERHIVCQLQMQDKSRFYADLNDVRIGGCRRFLLGIEGPLPRALVIEEVLQRAKLASHGDIEFVLARNVSGINIRSCDRPPAEVPTRPGLVYFDLPTPEEDVYWKHVRKDRNLVVWLPPGLEAERCSVRLYGILG